MAETSRQDSLRSCLDYEPVELKFGTSGRRGEVCHLTQLEVYINAVAELEYLQSLPAAAGGIVRGDTFYFAYDLRPSSSRFVESQGGRGEIAQTIVRAIRDVGMQPVNLGRIPTPALTHYAIAHARGSIMVTGSHIPFDRNGYKVNTACGELLKKDEKPIDDRVSQIRRRLYAQPFGESLFDSRGFFKAGHEELPPEILDARNSYIDRYLQFFRGRTLEGKRIMCYQHSAVGRDMLVEILERLGAEVIPCGRSETFVPIDTENISDAQVSAVQSYADRAMADHGPLFAVVSMDGDSDRPLILGVEPQTAKVRFLGGDLVGMIAAEYLNTDAVVVPISCNDAIDRGVLRNKLEPKTRIGSPYVIEGMEKAEKKGRKTVCGWEANGGFLTGSGIELCGHTLSALPTRDAVLPILSALFAASQTNQSLIELFARLPKRFSRASLLSQFPRSRSLKVIRLFSPGDGRIKEVAYEKNGAILSDENAAKREASAAEWREMDGIRRGLERLFTAEAGFAGIERINYIDGVRIIFSSGEVAHVRPSGNADELRIYAVADTQQRADEVARAGVAEPDGILRRMETLVMGGEQR